MQILNFFTQRKLYCVQYFEAEMKILKRISDLDYSLLRANNKRNETVGYRCFA